MRITQQQMAAHAQAGVGEAHCALVSRWIADAPFGGSAAEEEVVA